MEILFREFSVQGVLQFLSNTYGGANVGEAELSKGDVLQCSCNGGLSQYHKWLDCPFEIPSSMHHSMNISCFWKGYITLNWVVPFTSGKFLEQNWDSSVANNLGIGERSEHQQLHLLYFAYHDNLTGLSASIIAPVMPILIQQQE